MKKTSAALLAVPLAASMLLAGCGEDNKPQASSSSAASSSPTTTAAPTTSASPTVSEGRATDANVPSAARAHTPAGAIAFVRYFYAQVNIAWSKPKAGLISSLSATTCKSCAALEGTAADLIKKGQHYDGPPVTIVSVDHLGEVVTGNPEILVQFTQEHRNVIDGAGHVALTDQRKPGKFVATLGWSSRGWSVATVKSLA